MIKQTFITLLLLFLTAPLFSQIIKDDAINFFDEADFKQCGYIYVISEVKYDAAKKGFSVREDKYATSDIKINYRSSSLLIKTRDNVVLIPYARIRQMAKGKFFNKNASARDEIKIELLPVE